MYKRQTYDEAGEGVGFLRVSRHDVPSVLKSVEQHISKELMDMEYEDALRDFFMSTPVGVEKIGVCLGSKLIFPKTWNVPKITSCRSWPNMVGVEVLCLPT